jgi:hypothetical protein
VQWATWCAERGFEPLPADPSGMYPFTTQRVADGLAVISLSPFISVVTYVHSAHGLPKPNDNRLAGGCSSRCHPGGRGKRRP